MERFAACVNDFDHALRTLEPLLTAAGGVRHCVLVACPPRLGQRIGRWLSPAVRRQWRHEWAARLAAQLVPALAQAAPGSSIEWVVAFEPLAPLLHGLRLRHGASLALVDARHARVGAVAEAMIAGPTSLGARMAAPVAVASSLSLMLALAD